MKSLAILYDYGVVGYDVVEEFERVVDKCLPEMYKKLLVRHNALQFEENTFRFVSPEGDEERGCAFTGFGNGAYEKVQEMDTHIVDGFMDLIHFATCGNGDYICFDYRKDPKTCNPPVVIVLHDMWEEMADGSQQMVICDIAKDFESFIELLYKAD